MFEQTEDQKLTELTADANLTGRTLYEDAHPAKPADAGAAKPADAGAAKPADASTAKPADASTAKPADASTAKPADAAADKKNIAMKEIITALAKDPELYNRIVDEDGDIIEDTVDKVLTDKKSLTAEQVKVLEKIKSLYGPADNVINVEDLAKSIGTDTTFRKLQAKEHNVPLTDKEKIDLAKFLAGHPKCLQKIQDNSGHITPESIEAALKKGTFTQAEKAKLTQLKDSFNRLPHCDEGSIRSLKVDKLMESVRTDHMNDIAKNQHSITKGQNLWVIARRELVLRGEQTAPSAIWEEINRILKLNSNIKGPNYTIYAGSKLKLYDDAFMKNYEAKLQAKKV